MTTLRLETFCALEDAIMMLAMRSDIKVAWRVFIVVVVIGMSGPL